MPLSTNTPLTHAPLTKPSARSRAGQNTHKCKGHLRELHVSSHKQQQNSLSTNSKAVTACGGRLSETLGVCRYCLPLSREAQRTLVIPWFDLLGTSLPRGRTPREPVLSGGHPGKCKDGDVGELPILLLC